MSSWTSAAQVLPHFVIAVVGTAAGFSWSLRVAPEWDLPLGLAAFLLFLASVTFRRSPGWNAVFFYTFAVAGGAFFGRILPAGGLAWGWAAVVAAAVLVAMAAAGRAGLYRQLVPLWTGLWVFSWIYVGSWFVIYGIRRETPLVVYWAAAGVMIFALLGLSTFSRLRVPQVRPVGVSLGLELYILSLNLTLAIRLLGYSLALR
ncbi:MAG TPA: hypothetical protein VJ123_00270 [Anaerolineales bacterium]|nr:hypothetical protein [Anaerolineales bacterium]